jgi:3-hydroxybutyryl-CoA dehydrogenase
MKIGVIGAGTMGAGIAEAFAAGAGYQVVLNDITTELAQRGYDRIRASQQKLVDRGKITQDSADALLADITIGTLEDMADADLVIEAVLERMETKKELFTKLDAICGEQTILASNTSSLSITQIANGLAHPLVGMHFFNPAPVMKLVEVVAGASTPVAVLERVTSIATDLGKTPVQVKDAAGFVVNRVLIPMINEAVKVFAAGTASAEDIDTAMKLGANHPIGPLALGDLIGLDVCLAIMEVLQSETGDPKYRPHPLLRQYVRAGWLGRKTQRGFFSY